jgi:hypothetical protein
VVLIVCAGAAHTADSDVMATKAPPAPKRTGRVYRRLPAEDEPHSMWSLAPSGPSSRRSASRGVEEFALNWKFIFVLEAGLDPYPLQFANAVLPSPAFSSKPLSLRRAFTQSAVELRLVRRCAFFAR